MIEKKDCERCQRIKSAIDQGLSPDVAREANGWDECSQDDCPMAAGALASSRIARRPLRSVQPAMGNHSAAKSDPALSNRSSGRRGGGPGALAHMRAANMRARALAPVIKELRAAGFISYNAVSQELNRRQVPTLRRGKRWYPTTVSRLLVRLARVRS
jgi:hypothetical protein